MDHPDERVVDLSASLRAAYDRRTGSTRPGQVRNIPDPGSEQLARARTSFLVDEEVEPGVVREPILASWTRSRHYDVDAERLELPYDSDISMDSVLTRAAGPIIREVADQLISEPVSLILTDSDGVVLDRRSGDGGLTHHLDRIWLAPGFSYAERYVGTNGIGTALEGRGPAQVFGHEHYAEHLEDLACAGAPIRHPVSGKVMGVVDLTCWRSDANMMMTAIASTVAKRIEETLLEQSGRRELALLHDYLIACQRGRGAVFALSDDLLMMNDRARELFDPSDQGPLLAEAGEALKAGQRHQVLVDLPSGNTARIQLRPSWTEGNRAGGIAQVQLITNGAVPTPRSTAATPTLPAAVGSGALWAKCCQAVDRHFRAREWLVLEGEPGTGKTTIARATHQGRTPAAHLRVLDAEDAGPRWFADVAEELQTGGGTLVLAHVDRLDAEGVQALCDVLDEHRDTTDPERPWVVATVTAGTGSPEHLGELLAHFPSTVEVPPLRHHVEDVSELVPYLIARLTRGAELTCSPEAMRVLMRNRWPGNIEQLYQVLRKVVARRRTGIVSPADLPAECRAITRRVLTPLEAIECDAIVDALLDASGNKAEAARHLGMSRATIYRKIRGYGISMPTTG
ncbi:sigma-54-dependent Fis family transcriptional regulator [Pseudonocardia hydrocarbonoxydans]|uniref:Fis family transcriptional regulator n=1 Tax=Pseudonocardia hydrocarbonoxydans TaxID=76726 RepID=A0A4Y3WRV6_9PSEU|nr:helix-turn-helix domain-containing protein [Pseudonocardia hydrocarbonoxydans]GEC21248.1 Fis family transcriptional regulator [Pseudonocardia hydrocarbonoxydans]